MLFGKVMSMMARDQFHSKSYIVTCLPSRNIERTFRTLTPPARNTMGCTKSRT